MISYAKTKRVPFTRSAIRKYLDDCIDFWHRQDEEGWEPSEFYIDVYESVRMSIFGNLKRDDINEDI